MIDEVEVKLFKVSNRFLRSTHLERDWKDPNALADYILTNHARQSLKRISLGLASKSSLRAWRITGDYGSGKSSFALFLAHLYSGFFKETIDSDLNYYSKFNLDDNSKDAQLLPVLVTGSREPMGMAIIRGLKEAIANLPYPEKSQKLTESIEFALDNDSVEDTQVVKLVKAFQTHVIEHEFGKGMLLILDEAGKFFEFAAMHTHQQDIFLLQTLAEMAARSGKNPFYLIILLHQGIGAYAEGLPKPQQKEWEKISGRFEEVLWHHPVDQVAELIVNALNVQLEEIPDAYKVEANQRMLEALNIQWFGTVSQDNLLKEQAVHLYPLHPTVLPPLVRLFSNYGQNERSLFAFLLGNEPFGLQDFVTRTEGREFFRLHHLYDYVRAVFAHNLNFLGYRNHWKAIEATISTFSGDSLFELNILKCIGLLNILNADDLLAKEDIIELSSNSTDVRETLANLKDKHVIYFRGATGGYSLWPHTSINLIRVYQEAVKALEPLKNVVSFIYDSIETRPLVARKHYIQTGNLRYFDLVYTDLDSLAEKASVPTTSDGRVLIPLCESASDVEKVILFSTQEKLQNNPNLLIAIPEPLQGLAGAVEELRRWEWIERNVPELQHDKYALEEVSFQLETVRENLDNQIQMAVGITNQFAESGLRWFRNGEEVQGINNGRAVLSFISDICDALFPLSPKIKNELINRKILSGAAAGARLRLIERLFEVPNLPYLGMDESKRPPEMSMYLSVLQAAGLHQRVNEAFVLTLPDEEFDIANSNVRPSLNRIKEILQERVNARIPINEVFEELTKPPYGLREGLIPLFFAIFSVINEQELAFYEDGSFIPRLTGTNYLRIIKAPETFEVQYYPLSTVRSDLFYQLTDQLNIRITTPDQIKLLDVVKPLFTFAATLPQYTQKTSRLSPDTIKVREVLLTARDPANLIFRDLPYALGFAIDETTEMPAEQVKSYVKKLKNCIDELRVAYPALLEWIRVELQTEFNIDTSFEEMRGKIAPRAQALASFVTEARLKSFCLRIADTKLTENQWLEALGNLICAMPPHKWKDGEVHKYKQEIHNLCTQFQRVESVLFTQEGVNKPADSVRVALTQPDGQERGRVIHLSTADLGQVQALEENLLQLLKNQGQLGMAAASRVLWQMLSENNNAEADS